MGDISEAMLSGVLCQCCGVFVGEDVGYPVSCEDCSEDESEAPEIDFCCECDHFPSGAYSTFCPYVQKRVKRLTNAKNCEFAE